MTDFADSVSNRDRSAAFPLGEIMKTTGAASEQGQVKGVDGSPESVVDTDATAGAKSTGVGSTASIDSGLAGDHSSPEHDHGRAAARSNRRKPRNALKMPPYPGFEWMPGGGASENGYHYDKLSPSGDAATDCELGQEPNFGSHIVYVHVYVGETLSVRVGDDVQHIPGKYFS